MLDDELIGSRAQDVEKKTLSDRKADKEGPVADCLVDSLASIVYGFGLRISGESEQDNIQNLLGRLGDTFTSSIQQHIYCKGKGGLDKNTECCKNILNFFNTSLL